MRDRQTCVGCGKKSPETETNYTLISAQFGWRLTRYKSADGSLVVEWRCPTCWREYKRARSSNPDEPSPPSSGQHAAAPQAGPILRSPMPVPVTPFEPFRPRAPSTPGNAPARRSPVPPASRSSGPPRPPRPTPPPGRRGPAK